MSRLLFAACLCLDFALVPAFAAQTWWQHDPATPGDWFDPANWTAGVPGPADYAYIDNAGTAKVQEGSAQAEWLYLGYNASDAGAVELSGGTLSSKCSHYLGYNGTGRFIQTGGTNAVEGKLYLGNSQASLGTYDLSGGRLQVDADQCIGHRGAGVFKHTGGTNTAQSRLLLGCYEGSQGSYQLSGTGQLWADEEYVGDGGEGLFSQTGGVNTVGYLSVGPAGRYEFVGGALQISGGMTLAGELDCAGKAVTVDLSGDNVLVNLAKGTVLNAGQATLAVGANSLTIYAVGAHPSDLFGSFSTLGMMHQAGQTLVVALGQGFGGRGDIDDHVVCAGSISASGGGGMTLHDGVTVCVGGNVDLGSGKLIVEGSPSGVVAGASLSADREYVGSAGGGRFTQAGGENTVGSYLSVAGGQGSSGVYELSAGDLSCPTESIGSEGTGTFIQSGGTNKAAESLHLGYGAGGSGTYQLSGGQLQCPFQRVAYLGTGVFRHTGGTNTASYGLVLADCGGAGTYELSGNAQLSAGFEWVGDWGTGLFVHTAGRNSVDSALRLGGRDGSGTYELSGQAELCSGEEHIGEEGAGVFRQTGGSNTVRGGLYLARGFRSRGIYELSGGRVWAQEEHIGGEGEALFHQTGGTNVTSYLSIGRPGRYEFAGGALEITGGLDVEGELDCGGSAVTVNVGDNTLVDLSKGRVLNAGQATLAVGANSLTIYARGSDPSDLFGSFQTQGMTHRAGKTLIVPGSKGFGGWGDIDDHVVCAGWIAATAGGGINLNGGLRVSGTGRVELGSGELTVNDTTSGISGRGSVRAWQEHVGYPGVARFRQTGGTNTIEEELYLGHEKGSSGTYELTGGELRCLSRQSVGFDGDGLFAQTGGLNDAHFLLLGFRPDSQGSYELSGGHLRSDHQYIGRQGGGLFRQSGGVNTVSHGLLLGVEAGGQGTYQLSGHGVLSADEEIVGTKAAGVFSQSGGTHTVGRELTIGSYPASDGTYELAGGQLSSNSAAIGLRGRGLLTQTGGTNTVAGGLCLGRYPGSEGVYTISQGSLSTSSLLVGEQGRGTLHVTGPGASIFVQNMLRFGPRSTFTAVPGGTIHMAGSSLENESTDPAALAGLENLRLIFEGGGEVVADFEVAGEDLGLLPAGWVNNFALGALQLGGQAGAGHVRLVDDSDNQPGQAEALYVDSLVLNPGWMIDLNGLNLYFLNGGDPKQFLAGDANLDGTVDGLDYNLWSMNYNAGCESGWSSIPEPAALLVVVAGVPLLLRRRRLP